MSTNLIGRNIKQAKGFKAFVPEAFPHKALFNYSPQIIKKDTEASRLLGKLDGVTQLLPDVDFFIYMYIRKDAAASSQIEGTKATMIDAIEANAKIQARAGSDVDDILHYIEALNYGLNQLKDTPLTLKFLCDVHQKLMINGRTTHFSDPGNFRRSQNWIHGKSPADAEFVPPPVDEMNQALYDLENFIYQLDAMPPLIKAALIHAQFETIHPFLDGNGRAGRMLIAFYLGHEKLLEKPVLYLSSYFKKYKKIYYQRLMDYREEKIENWLEFFLDGIIETAQSAIETAREITVLRERDMTKIINMNKTASATAIEILPKLFEQPIVMVSTVQKWTNFKTRTGAQKVIDRLVSLGILKIDNEKAKYNRIYVYQEYLDIFGKSLS